MGDENLNPSDDGNESIVIRQPTTWQTIKGGTLHIEGLVRPLNEKSYSGPTHYTGRVPCRVPHGYYHPNAFRRLPPFFCGYSLHREPATGYPAHYQPAGGPHPRDCTIEQHAHLADALSASNPVEGWVGRCFARGVPHIDPISNICPVIEPVRIPR